MKTKKPKQKVSGQFNTETKFIEFVGGKGHVNFISKEATIEGKYLSGLSFNDLVFKLKIYDDGTVDFDEVNTTKTTFEERKRLLEIIEDQSLTSYRNRTVINELEFTSVEKVKEKTVPLYLAVEYTTPIEKLSSLFDDRLIVPNEISDDAMDNLNDLLNSWFEDEEFAKEIEEMVGEEEDIKGFIDDTIMEHHDINDSTLEAFTKMKEDKLNELKSKRTKIEEEIMRYSFQISSIEKNLEESKNDLKILESRINDIQPNELPNGYYFNVSERQNETVILEPEIESLIKDKVSKVKNINLDAFMKLFTDGEYHLRLSKISDDSYEVVSDFSKLPDDILENLSKIDITIDKDKMVYMGDLSWGEIVNKMIKIGFQQNPEFDKFCGSNSYSSTQKTKEEIKTTKTQF
jgi:hypothetical protein